jgi:sigma-B regulation protein RsbU (phosphoserine phosphatase)
MNADEKQLLDLEFNSCTSNLQDIRHRIRETADQAGCSEELVQKLTLVIDEAIANVIRHGYKGTEGGDIRLRVFQRDELLWFELIDWAETVDPGCIKPRDLSECRPGGLGVNFMDSVMDSWEFKQPPEGSGNVLLMSKKIERESA